ncbi:hypothetical protein [Streptomyces sp. NPDC002952]|uniref:hypothetical protein n=1 Tax=Streptomyces sp. NPDC002952 TaxID=3364673 RepID=UPI0036BFB630
MSAASAAASLGCVLALPRRAAPGPPAEGPGRRRGQGIRRDGTARALRTLRGSPALALLMVQGMAVFTLARLCQVNLFQPVLLHHGVGD